MCIRDSFGIDTIAAKDWAEATIGNASVVVPCKDEPHERYIPVALAFDNQKPSFRVHGRCGSNHTHTSKP